MEFFTATCLNWNHLLSTKTHKDIIMDSLQFLVRENRIHLFAYVIMPNHIHLLWEKQAMWYEKNIQLMFMKFTAQQIKFRMLDNHDRDIYKYTCTQSDRQFQFWERRPWRAQINNRFVAEQKLEYIHWNPVKAGLSETPEEYPYSSTVFYEQGIDERGILTHFLEHVL
jgi:putative transposase